GRNIIQSKENLLQIVQRKFFSACKNKLIIRILHTFFLQTRSQLTIFADNQYFHHFPNTVLKVGNCKSLSLTICFSVGIFQSICKSLSSKRTPYSCSGR